MPNFTEAVIIVVFMFLQRESVMRWCTNIVFIFIGMLHYIGVSAFIDVVDMPIYIAGEIVVLKCVFKYN